MSLHLQLTNAEVLARADATHVQEANGHAFALMRMIASDMEQQAKENTSDNGMVETWAGALRWLVTTLDEQNDELRNRYREAGWLNLPGQQSAA